MESGQFEQQVVREIEKYEQVYEEYNSTLEKTIQLVEELKRRFKGAQSVLTAGE